MEKQVCPGRPGAGRALDRGSLGLLRSELGSLRRDAQQSMLPVLAWAWNSLHAVELITCAAGGPG